jgi:3',5'-cyclic AMP phosphodiesterase CpdA
MLNSTPRWSIGFIPRRCVLWFPKNSRIRRLCGGAPMRTLIHLSDLHFGRIDQTLIQPLVAVIEQIQPSVIAVSGDLTQRARREEFQEARAFLRALHYPQIVVPGNHDVPLYNVPARFLHGLQRYRRYISPDLEPFYADSEIVALGLNTARSLAFKGGRISAAQIAHTQERLRPFGDDVTKIIVTHHPFELPEPYDRHALVGQARMAMDRLATSRIDIFLAGHLHISHAGPTSLRINSSGRSAILVQAGTATSTRSRGEGNAFNVIRIQKAEIVVERFAWQHERQIFVASVMHSFRRSPSGWTSSSS